MGGCTSLPMLVGRLCNLSSPNSRKLELCRVSPLVLPITFASDSLLIACSVRSLLILFTARSPPSFLLRDTRVFVSFLVLPFLWNPLLVRSTPPSFRELSGIYQVLSLAKALSLDSAPALFYVDDNGGTCLESDRATN